MSEKKKGLSSKIQKSSMEGTQHLRVAQWGFGERGGEELWLQSQEGRELSAAAAAGQLILKMISEHQTVDHRNKLMGNDPDSIFVRFRTAYSTRTNKL